VIGDFFDPNAELLVHDRLRPHWSQSGAIVFVTFRTNDSIPSDVIQRWGQKKNDWMNRRGLSEGRHWSDVLLLLDEPTRAEFNRCREDFLDDCHGPCLLRDPMLAQTVADSLMHFDGDRYRMGDFVVMPNHVHLLAAFPNPESMASQFDSWTHYTAYRIHQAIGEKGRFWQQEPFDHVVRSIEQYDYLRHYIAENPSKARLRAGEYYYRKGP